MDYESLHHLGWQPFFQLQIKESEVETLRPVRVMDQFKHLIEAVGEDGRIESPLLGTTPPLAVGDWVLVDDECKIVRVLERKTVFKRKAAGNRVDHQIIAANVDVAFMVCSLNEDFNLSRIERYLSLIHESGADPVVVLSKKDLCDDPESYRDEVQRMDPSLCVETVNGLDAESAKVLFPWCEPGSTIVMLGSSGSGKSTLTNTLLGEELQDTAEIRENDGKGRHTTTRRSLICLPNGSLILDTPGMRELQLTDCGGGVSATFADVESLSLQCKFSNCTHVSEPGCAVQTAIEAGDLLPRRLQNYQKLMREQARNAASIAQRHADNRVQGQFYKRVKEAARNRKQFRDY
jgi:ribosome biogenesis GTPase